MGRRIKVKAPATLSNLNCGFDVLGLAINEPYDIIDLELTTSGEVEIAEITGCTGLSHDPALNVAGVVLNAIKAEVGGGTGFRIRISKGINPGSGIGSSAASSAGAACAANMLLDNRFSDTVLVQFAMEGERLASGSAHADNVAPAIMGGITLIRSYDPLEIVRLNIPGELYCVVIHPGIEVKTSEARKVLDKEIPLSTAVRQWGNLGGFIAGLYREDYELISHSLKDYIAEPKRAVFIPHFAEIRQSALDSGALGAGISGSGPSLFALCRGRESAAKVYKSMTSVMEKKAVSYRAYCSPVSNTGVVAL